MPPRSRTSPTSHLLDVYDCWIHVSTDRRQLAALRRRYPQIPKHLPGDFGGTTRFRVSPPDGVDLNHYVIDIDVAAHRGNHLELINTAAHEATHAAALILDSTCATYDGDSEPLAWLVGWVTRFVWEAIHATEPDATKTRR